MDEWIKELIRQVPALVIVAWLFYRVLVTQKELAALQRDIVTAQSAVDENRSKAMAGLGKEVAEMRGLIHGRLGIHEEKK